MARRDWKTVHDFEMKEKHLFLKKLTAKDSFRIFANLYEFTYNCLGKKNFKKITLDKIKLLSHIHSMFNKVKA